MRLIGGMVVAAALGGMVGLASANEAPTILSGAPSPFSASSEVEAFICFFNEKGGMMTEMVETALSAAGLKALSTINFIDTPSRIDLSDTASTRGVIFPMYKPRCDDTHMLNDHTAALCEGFKWSAPLFRVITAGYVAAQSDWTPTSNTMLIGKTICQIEGEIAQFMRQRGLTALNSRQITARTPEDCLASVVAGESDIAVLPMVGVDAALRSEAFRGKLRHAPALDRVLTMHAIARLSDAGGVADIFALDEGLAKIRADGTWFDIVKEHYAGHSHEAPHHDVIAGQ